MFGVTDVPTYSCRSPFDVAFLEVSQPHKQLLVANKTYQGLSGRRQSMPCHLERKTFNRCRIRNKVCLLLAVHDYTHILDEAVDDLE
jgi:hypothetical protein